MENNALVCCDDLRYVGQPAERGAIQQAVAVSLVIRSAAGAALFCVVAFLARVLAPIKFADGRWRALSRRTQGSEIFKC